MPVPPTPTRIQHQQAVKEKAGTSQMPESAWTSIMNQQLNCDKGDNEKTISTQYQVMKTKMNHKKKDLEIFKCSG